MSRQHLDEIERRITRRRDHAIAAAAKWLMEDDSAYTSEPEMAWRAAMNMFRVADEALLALMPEGASPAALSRALPEDEGRE